jgi:hypothetical protein
MRCSVRHCTHYRRLVFARSQVSLASLLSGLSDRALCADRSPVNAGFSIRRTIIVNMHLTLQRRVQAWGDLHCLFPCVNHAQVDLKPPSTFRIPGTHNFCFHTRAWIPSSSVRQLRIQYPLSCIYGYDDHEIRWHRETYSKQCVM